MSYPPRLGHLATRQVIASRLLRTFAKAHTLDDDEAHDRIERALAGRLWEQLLEATWAAMSADKKRLTDDALLEKIAGVLKAHPLRYAKAVPVTPAWSAFLVLADLEAGTATESARRVLESPEGQRRMQEGIAEVGRFLAAELTKG
jgi:hypothetical protein